MTDARNGLTKPRLNLRAALGVGGCSTKLSQSSFKAPHTGGTFSLTVTPSSADCAWSVAIPTTAPWLHVVGAASGTGPGSITLQVDPITTTATARSTGVTITAAGETASSSALISQAAFGAASAADTRPPVMTRLQGSTSAPGSLTLTWAPARDTQSGVSGYRVVYNAGTRPPSPRCISGTVVEDLPVAVSAGGDGTNTVLQLTVAGLSAGSRYSFRVCAIDAAANVSGGTLWRGTAS